MRLFAAGRLEATIPLLEWQEGRPSDRLTPTEHLLTMPQSPEEVRLPSPAEAAEAAAALVEPDRLDLQDNLDKTDSPEMMDTQEMTASLVRMPPPMPFLLPTTSASTAPPDLQDPLEAPDPKDPMETPELLEPLEDLPLLVLKDLPALLDPQDTMDSPEDPDSLELLDRLGIREVEIYLIF